MVWLQEFMFPFIKKAVNSDLSQKVVETFVTRILLIGIGLVTSVIVARILGPEGRGLYAVALAVGAIGMQFGNLGLHASNTYYVSRDRSLLPLLVSNTLLVSFAFGGTGALLAGPGILSLASFCATARASPHTCANLHPGWPCLLIVPKPPDRDSRGARFQHH